MFIEQMMFFALGLLTALLFTLGMVPARSRRAMRLARRKLELQLPLSAAEIMTERDQLRADFAVQLRIAEQKIEANQQAYAEISGKLGQNLSEVVTSSHHTKLINDQLSQTTEALTQTRRHLYESEGEKAAALIALHEESRLLTQAQDRMKQMTMSENKLNDEINELKAERAGMDAMKAGLELQQLDIQRRISETEKKLVLAAQENQILKQERDLARLEAENLTKSRGKKPIKPEEHRLEPEDVSLLRETILTIAADVLRQTVAREPVTSPLYAMIAEAKINKGSQITSAEKSLMDRVISP